MNAFYNRFLLQSILFFCLSITIKSHLPRMRGIDVRSYRGLQQLPQRRPVVRQRLDTPTRASSPPMRVGVLPPVKRRRMRATDPGRRHAAPPQNIRQHGGALHVLHQQRYHIGQLRLAQRVAQRARPMDVVDGRMRVLIVRQMDVLHGQHGQFVRSGRVASVLHVPGDGEQLRGGHDVRRGVDDDLVGRFEG